MGNKKDHKKAKKENKAMKSDAKKKGKAAEVKEFASNTVDNVVAAKNAVFKKAAEVKASAVHAAQTTKSDIKADIQKVGQINRDISTGFGKVVSDFKHTDHDVEKNDENH